MGCNCGGKCNDCKKIKSNPLKKNFCDPYFTGNIKYDGTGFEACTEDEEIVLASGDGLNDIIDLVFEKLCTLTKRSNDQASVNGDLEDSIAATENYTTSELTIPEDGKYLVNFGMNVTLAAGAECRVYVKKTNTVAATYSGGRQAIVQNSTDASEYQNVSNTMILDLLKDDTLALYAEAFSAGVSFTGFSITAVKLINPN